MSDLCTLGIHNLLMKILHALNLELAKIYHSEIVYFRYSDKLQYLTKES